MSMMILGALIATLAAAGSAWLLAVLADARVPARSGVLVWRAARLAAFSPLLVAVAAPLARLWRPGPVEAAIADAGQNAGATALLAVDVAPVLIAVSHTAASLPGWAGPAAAAVYLAGLAAAGLKAASRRRAMRRLLLSSRPAGLGMERIAARWRARLGLAPWDCPVRVVDAELSPFVVGLNPVIIAPEAMETAPNANFALAHECMHVRRGDEADRLIGEVLAVLLWFNPVVRAIERRLAGARELACDADLLAHLDPHSAQDYAAAIAATAPGAAATGFLSELRDLRRRRVEAALNPRRGRARVITLAAALAVSGASAAPAAALVLAISAGGAQAAEPVRQLSPRLLSAPVGETVLEIQALMDAEDYQGMLALTGAVLDDDLTAYERSVLLRLEGNALFQLGDYPSAADRFERAIATGALMRDEEGALHLNAAQLHAVLENHDQAAAHLDRLTALDYAIPDFQKMAIARMYAQVRRFEAAAGFAEDAIEAMDAPGVAQLALLERIYAELGREADRARIEARRQALEQ